MWLEWVVVSVDSALFGLNLKSPLLAGCLLSLEIGQSTVSKAADVKAFKYRR